MDKNILKIFIKIPPMDQDRKSKIFAPFVKVGGVVKPIKKKPASTVSFANVVAGLKDDLTPTILKTCTYRDDKNNIYNYESAKVQSITKGKKHVCFLVTGEPSVMSQEEAIKNMPENIEDTIRRMSEQETKEENVD